MATPNENPVAGLVGATCTSNTEMTNPLQREQRIGLVEIGIVVDPKEKKEGIAGATGVDALDEKEGFVPGEGDHSQMSL